jgi:hypothetical protein
MRGVGSIVWVLLLAIALLGCGSGSSSTRSAPPPVPGGAKARASSTAPGYCKELTRSASLLSVGKAMSEMAANPGEDSARATIDGAAGELRRAAEGAPHHQGQALLLAAAALRSLAEHGLGKAARAERGLTRAGHLIGHSCGFPVG